MPVTVAYMVESSWLGCFIALVTFLRAVTEYLTKQLREGLVSFGPRLRVGKALQSECESWAHCIQSLKGRGTMSLHRSTSHLPLCIQSGTLDLPSSRFLKWLSRTCPEVCLLSNSKSSQVDKMKT